MRRLLGGLDRFQQRHAVLAVPLAVMKKFGDDQAGSLAALVAYYGFFSLFPLLLVLVTVLGIVASGDPSLRDRILNSALAQFPVMGADIRRSIGTISGSGLTLVIGIVGALWAGLGGVKALESAMNRIWDVPAVRQRGLLWSTIRALLMLAILGTVSVIAAFAGSIGTGPGVFLPLRILGILISLLLNLAVFLLAFKILTDADVSWRDVFPGAMGAAVVWAILQVVGGYYVSHQLRSASNTFGMFAIVIGLLTWLYLGAQLTLLAAETNVVRVRRMWPRAFSPPPLTEADRRALAAYAKAEQRRPEERVDVTFDGEERRVG